MVYIALSLYPYGENKNGMGSEKSLFFSLFCHGNGGSKNHDEAKSWLRKVARQGDETAKQKTLNAS